MAEKFNISKLILHSAVWALHSTTPVLLLPPVKVRVLTSLHLTEGPSQTQTEPARSSQERRERERRERGLQLGLGLTCHFPGPQSRAGLHKSGGGEPRQDIGPSKIQSRTVSMKPRLLSKYDIENSYLWLHIFHCSTFNTFLKRKLLIAMCSVAYSVQP